MDYKVQSVLFLKSKWNETTASRWLMEHSYKVRKADITEKHLRFRQINPDYLKKLGYTQYATKNIGDGISLILVYKDGGQQGGAVSVSNVKKFIDASYKKNADERIDDYILDKSLSNDYAKTYYNPKTKQAVVVHRGTSGASDWLNNVAYATGVYNYTNRYKTGKQIQEKANKKYGKSNISTLGHSQGAVLSRKLGADSKEIINVNPAYMGETKGKNEYNIRSSSDLVSGILAPVNVISSTLFPKYTKNHEITIQSDNPVDVLTEHSPEILNRLEQDRMIGKGLSGGAMEDDFLLELIEDYNNILASDDLTINKIELLDNLINVAEIFNEIYPNMADTLIDEMYITSDEYNTEINALANEEDIQDAETLVPRYKYPNQNAGDETDDELNGGIMRGGIKSPFCRTGSKFSMRNMIVPIIPAHKVYVELFAGSASIFFSKEKAEINVLNDLDKGVINKFKALVKAPDNIESYNTDLNTRDKIRHFYDNHSNTPQNKLLLEKITSCNGFGSKPVRYSGMIYKGSNPYNSLVKHLPEYKELLKGVKLETKDYEKIVKKYDSPQTFFFIDPPYENTNTSFGYAEDVKFDFIRLRKVLDKIKGSFLLTINDSPQIRSLFKGFKLTPVKIPSGFRNAGLGKNTGDFDKSRGELMITNYIPEHIEGGRKTREQMSEKTRKRLEEMEARMPPFTYSFLDDEAFENDIMATWHGLQMMGVPLDEVKRIIAGVRKEQEQAVLNYLRQMEREDEETYEMSKYDKDYIPEEDYEDYGEYPYADYGEYPYADSDSDKEEEKKEGGAIYEDCDGYCGGVIEFNDSDDDMCGGGNPFGRFRRIAPDVLPLTEADVQALITQTEGIRTIYANALENATANDNEVEMNRLITLIGRCDLRINQLEGILADIYEFSDADTNTDDDSDDDEEEKGDSDDEDFHPFQNQVQPAPAP